MFGLGRQINICKLGQIKIGHSFSIEFKCSIIFYLINELPKLDSDVNSNHNKHEQNWYWQTNKCFCIILLDYFVLCAQLFIHTKACFELPSVKWLWFKVSD